MYVAPRGEAALNPRSYPKNSLIRARLQNGREMNITALLLLGLFTPQGYLKGQLHAHTAHSGDSQTPIAEVTQFYADRGYDFLVLTDHNIVTVAQEAPSGLLVFPGVELTQNLEDCRPALLEKLPCLLHTNALLVEAQQSHRVRGFSSTTLIRLDHYAAAIRWGVARGGVMQINHPNFYYAADGPLVAQLAQRGARLLEVANEAVDSNNAGAPPLHPSTETLWDEALTTGARIYATATDDAHHYSDAAAIRARGKLAYTGDRGFVMVRANRNRASIQAALSTGRFYASNGPLLHMEGLSADGTALLVEVAAEIKEPLIEFIGRGGRLLSSHRDHSARYPLSKLSKGSYVRARVTDQAGRRVWVQPVWRANTPDLR